MNKSKTKVPMRQQSPGERKKNFKEVPLGYSEEEAMLEASRCLGCKKPQCVLGCPVEIDIPAFIEKIKEGEFLEAVKTRKQPPCTTEEGYYSTSTVKLAMIAYDIESKITWDKESQTITGNPRAAKLMQRDYRKPWKHPYKG